MRTEDLYVVKNEINVAIQKIEILPFGKEKKRENT